MPEFRFRHVLKPGITGWAQTHARYAANAQETREKLSYDLYYVKHVSLLVDLWIVAKTFQVIFQGTNAR